MERQTCPEIGWYQSFGLAVYCTRPGSQVLLTTLFDISLDRAFVERLAEDCTRFQLDPVHLMDVAEDALAKKESKTAPASCIPARETGALVFYFWFRLIRRRGLQRPPRPSLTGS